MRRFIVSLLAALIAMGPTTAHASEPDHPQRPGRTFGGGHDSGGITIDGTKSSPSSPSNTTGSPELVSLSCEGNVARELANLGDVASRLGPETCFGQGLACAIRSGAANERLDPVLTVQRQGDETWQYAGVGCVGRVKAQVTAAMVRERVVRRVPSARVGLAPHGSTLVNIETVMWAVASRQRTLQPILILGQRVSIRLVLDHVSWRFGDGEGDAEGPAGRAYDTRHPCRSRICDRYFGHVYTRTGRVTVRAIASWHASFTVGGGGPVDIPGTVAGPARKATITVKQARGVLVPNPDESP